MLLSSREPLSAGPALVRFAKRRPSWRPGVSPRAAPGFFCLRTLPPRPAPQKLTTAPTPFCSKFTCCRLRLRTSARTYGCRLVAQRDAHRQGSGPAAQTGAEFKAELQAGQPKFGIFVNSVSPTVAEQLSCSGYDWLLVDTQHGPMEPITLSAMLCAISSGGAKSMVRVAGHEDRAGIQQALDLGAHGILIPYVNTADDVAKGVSCCRYPLPSGAECGTRSVYFPQRSTNQAGLLGYAGAHNDNVIVAVQVETKACIDNMEEICKVPGVDIMFLGQNDLCMSMGLFGGQCTPAPPATLLRSTLR